MEKFKEYAAVCTVGSVGYSAIEVLWRGFTHWTMALTGGVGFLLLLIIALLATGEDDEHDGTITTTEHEEGGASK